MTLGLKPVPDFVLANFSMPYIEEHVNQMHNNSNGLTIMAKALIFSGREADQVTYYYCGDD